MDAVDGIGLAGHRRAGAARLPGLAAALLLSTFLVALALSAVAAGTSVLAWDVTVSRFIQRAPEAAFGDVAYIVSLLGDTPVMVALGGGLVLALAACRRLGPALFLMAAGVACAANPLLKALIASPRPTADLVRVTEFSSGQGFPSGHVMKVVLVYGAILLLSRQVLPRRGPRLLVQTWSIGMIVATGLSRIYVGAHWPSDVVGAYLWSGLLLGLVVVGYRFVSALDVDTMIGGTRMQSVQMASAGRGRRIGLLGVGVLFAAALTMLLAGSLAAQAPMDDRTWPSQIRAGTCDQLAATAFDLNPVGAARSDDEDDDDRDDTPGGDYVGAAGAVQVATSGTEVRANLDDLLAQPHAVVVTAGADDDTVVACGEIGGYLRGSDDLFIGLKPQGGSGVSGVALFDGDDDGNEVEVTIYLTAAADAAATPAV